MAIRSKSQLFVAAMLMAIAMSGCLSRTGNFLAPSLRGRGAGKIARSSYESGKVNLGVSADADGNLPFPEPVLAVNDATRLAIYDCVEEGCSVEALMALDQKLASDESRLLETINEVQEKQKTSLSEDNQEALAWLRDSLNRSTTLRAQLQALKGNKDTDFIKQLVKAAAIAFGGVRKGDYPAVGVSAYSA